MYSLQLKHLATKKRSWTCRMSSGKCRESACGRSRWEMWIIVGKLHKTTETPKTTRKQELLLFSRRMNLQDSCIETTTRSCEFWSKLGYGKIPWTQRNVNLWVQGWWILTLWAAGSHNWLLEMLPSSDSLIPAIPAVTTIMGRRKLGTLKLGRTWDRP